MRASFILLMSCLLSGPALAAPAPACDLVITSVNVLDLESQETKENMDVFIADGEITSVRAHTNTAGEKCREELEARGKFLMPGLVDMHTHANAIFLPRKDDYMSITNTIPLTLEQAGAMMLRGGVTAFLDLCSTSQRVMFDMRDRQRSGRLKMDMPDIYTAGSCITSKWHDRKGDPNQFNDEKQIADVTLLEKVDDYKEAYPKREDKSIIYGFEVKEKASELAKIDRLLDKKPDVLKVFYTLSWDKGAHYPSLHVDTIREIVKRAHARNVPVLAHALEWDEQVPMLLQAKVDGLAHGATDNRPSEGFEVLKDWHPRKSIVVVPTVTVFNGLGRLNGEYAEFDDPLLASVLDAAGAGIKDQVLYEFNHMRGVLKERMDRLEQSYTEQYDTFMVSNVKRYKRDERFNVLMGSDASNLGAFLGFSMHQEVDSMVKDAKYSNWEALARATIEPAKFLKAKYGTRAGDVANFLILDKSPIHNIKNTRTIRRVILRGKPL